ncbi:MAG: hypothetical protein CM15mP83_3670 [Flavobacteriaceae bacterium]|nr:MAG: hypothetical protein CM15mP83_3670 [Flavobacteriaceae bacterium]
MEEMIISIEIHLGSITRKPSCTTYTIRLRDNDNDGIFDIIDADKNNEGDS